MTVVEDQRTLQPRALELFFSSDTPVEEEKQGNKTVLWKDILRTGEIARTPGRADKVPFTIVAEGRSSSSKRVIAMSDIIKSFDAKAFEDVTIPDGHPKPDRIDPKTKTVIKGDSALNNTGYVEALRIVKKDVKLGDSVLKDCHVLQGGMAFTEPEVANKVKRGSVPNVSSGIFFDFVRKADDRYFPCALNHVALTKTPWISGLESFPRAYFGDEILDGQDGVELEVLNFLDDNTTGTATASVIWNDGNAANQVRDAISQALNPPRNYDEDSDISVPRQPRPYYWVQDVTHNEPNLAQVEESYKGKTTKFVVPYSIGEDGSVEVAPATRWVEGKQAMIAASDGDGTFDPLESFAATSFGKLRDKLGIALSDLLGDEAKNLSVKEVSTEHKALIENTKSGAVHLATWYGDSGSAVFFGDTSTWETITAPSNKVAAKRPVPTATPVVDLSTPEGRVKAARQRRAALLSSSTTQ